MQLPALGEAQQCESGCHVLSSADLVTPACCFVAGSQIVTTFPLSNTSLSASARDDDLFTPSSSSERLVLCVGTERLLLVSANTNIVSSDQSTVESRAEKTEKRTKT